MLCLVGRQVESLFDLGLPVEVAELPVDLAALDVLLGDPGVLAAMWESWDASAGGRAAVGRDGCFVRLMVIKARSGWGYETLVREVSDSLHLRRFCRIGLWERVRTSRRSESSCAGSARTSSRTSARGDRQGDEPERRFVARAARIDSTVVEADIRYPTDLGLAQDAARCSRAKPPADELAGAGRRGCVIARARSPTGCAG